MSLVREVVPFTTEEAWLAEREKDLTSTDVAALFGMSPYKTAFELYQIKRGGLEPAPVEGERLRWGQILQDSIAKEICEQKDWHGHKLTDYIRLPEHRVGASFDWEVEAYGENCLLEVKNVDSLEFHREWQDEEFGLQAPAHIEAQLQTQLLVRGYNRGFIGALIGGNRLELIERPYFPDVGEGILKAANEFWNGQAPAPDFRADAQTIARMFRHADPGVELQADEHIAELMRRHAEFGAAEAAARDNREALKAELLTLIGPASKVFAPGLRLNCEERGPTEVAAHTRKGYRNFRIFELKL